MVHGTLVCRLNPSFAIRSPFHNPWTFYHHNGCLSPQMGNVVEVRHPDTGRIMEGVVNKMFDTSMYTVGMYLIPVKLLNIQTPKKLL